MHRSTAQEPGLFTLPPPKRTFRGETYSPQLDEKRLSRQLDRVRDALLGGGKWTLAELAAASGGSEAGVSARIRDLRRVENGGYDIRREWVSDGGLHHYWMVLPGTGGVVGTDALSI